jgi:hypothetical protein
MLEPGFTMYSRTWEEMYQKNCPYCGKELTHHQAASSGICGAPRCHAKMIEKVGAELIERKRRENAEYVQKVYAKVATDVYEALDLLGAEPQEVAFAVVPWQREPVVPLPEERKAAFRDHLRLIVDRAFLEPVTDADLSYRDDLDIDEPPVMGAACAACQGGCCALGGNSGFLHDVDIQRYRQQNPQATKEEVIELYLGLLPETSTRDACVYQSASGCTVPRSLRNDQCNAFYCKSLRRLQENYGASAEGKAVLIAADHGAPRNVAAFDLVNGRRVVASYGPGEHPSEGAGEEPQAAPVETITISSGDFEEPI